MTDSNHPDLLDKTVKESGSSAADDGSSAGARGSVEAHRIETRERIVSAAAEVFLEKGFTGTRVVDIARRAGFTSGALYAYFESRAELLAEAVGDASGEVLDHVFDPEREGGSSLAELLTAALAQVTRPLESSGQMLLDGVALSQREPTVGKRLAAALGGVSDDSGDTGYSPAGTGSENGTDNRTDNRTDGTEKGRETGAKPRDQTAAGPGDQLSSTEQELLVILILGVTAARALGLHNPLPPDLGEAIAGAVAKPPGVEERG